MLEQIFFRRVDNSPLVLFRMIFGLLCFLEATGAMALGWVQRVFVEPEFTFNFIGFDWLQSLQGEAMYLYFSLMAVCALGVMMGLFYRWSAWGWALLWTGAYLMQKSAYNNHYYLLMLLSYLMAVMPAHRSFSLDVRRRPALRSHSMPAWCRWLFIVQMGIVYSFAALAKLYPDWWSGRFIGLSFDGRFETPWLAAIFENPGFQLVISYSGFCFDLLIVPLLLIRRTRPFAVAAAVFFHLFNSIVFRIGIFPYLALATILFFFPPEQVRKTFFPKKPVPGPGPREPRSGRKVLMAAISLYLLVQLILPLRHHFIDSNVYWTEEGHRLSWRMMLSSRHGQVLFYVKDKATDQESLVPLGDFLSDKQRQRIAVEPDMMWQFAQYLKRYYARQGKQVEVRAAAYKSINGRELAPFTDSSVDLASVDWEPLQAAGWILPFPGWR